MNVRVVTARWIATGTHADGRVCSINDAPLAHENGEILAVGRAEEVRRNYPDAPEAS